jgi:hypothetical protein
MILDLFEQTINAFEEWIPFGRIALTIMFDATWWPHFIDER